MINESGIIGSGDGYGVQAKAAYSDPIQDYGIDVSWFAGYINNLACEWRKCRTEKDQRAGFTFRVLNRQTVDKAMHHIVEPPYRHREGAAFTFLDKWALNVRNYLMPPKSKWLVVDTELKDAKAHAEALREKVWEKLEGNEGTFRDTVRSWVFRSSGTFGGVVRVSYEEYYNQKKLINDWRPCFEYYDFDEFLLDPDQGAEGPIIFSKRYTKAEMRRLSEELKDEEGNVIRGPVFDPGAVEKLLANGNREAPTESYAKERRGREPGGDSVVFDCLEFVGTPEHPDQDLPDNQIITVCGSVVLRATDSPRQKKMWALLGWRDSLSKDPYPESIGEALAEIETEINRAKTLAASGMVQQIAGVWKFNTSRADDVKKYGRFFSMVPGRAVPDIFDPVSFKLDYSPVQMIEQSAIKRMKEMIGISDAALAGAPTPGVTATESANKAQGAATGNESDATHYLGPLKYILSCVVDLYIEEMVDEFEVTLEDGQVVQMNKEIGEALMATVNINTESMGQVAPWQMAQIQTLRTMQSANQAEVDAYLADTLGVPEAWKERIFAPPPQMMSPPGAPGAGPAVDPFPMNPDGTPMLQAVQSA